MFFPPFYTCRNRDGANTTIVIKNNRKTGVNLHAYELSPYNEKVALFTYDHCCTVSTSIQLRDSLVLFPMKKKSH